MAASVIRQASRTEIELTGILARKFGRTHWKLLDSGQVWEGFKAMKCTVEGFEDEIKRLSRLGLRFAIFRNKKNVGEKDFQLGGTRVLKIMPVVRGAKRGGVLQTVLGIVLIVAGVLTYNPALVAAGVASAAGGVIQMLSPQQGGLSQSGAPENMPSYAFGSARNTTASGNPVPICIGHRRWGGAIISAGIYAEDKT